MQVEIAFPVNDCKIVRSGKQLVLVGNTVYWRAACSHIVQLDLFGKLKREQTRSSQNDVG